MKKTFRPVRGMRDILPPESEEIAYIESTYRKVARLFGYKEVIPPTIESFELFAVKSGEEIRESMYEFKDKAGRHVALRPEVTASIARIYINRLLAEPKPIRLFYLVNCFRYDEPQFGRYREFRQGGVELIGASGPLADAEPILFLVEFYRRIGLPKYNIVIGHIGIYSKLFEKFRVDPDSSREVLRLIDKGEVEEAIKRACSVSSDPEGLKLALEELSGIRGAPSRVREEALRTASSMEYLSGEIRELVEVGEIVESTGAKVTVDPTIARGLEYYTGIIYEVKVPTMDISIGGGGRYDILIETFGGPPTPATGNAIGIERTLLALKSLEVTVKLGPPVKVAILQLDPKFSAYAVRVQRTLHSLDIPAELVLQRRSLGRMLSELAKRGYTHAAIVGERENAEGAVTLRDLRSKKQTLVELERVGELLLKSVGGPPGGT